MMILRHHYSFTKNDIVKVLGVSASCNISKTKLSLYYNLNTTSHNKSFDSKNDAMLYAKDLSKKSRAKIVELDYESLKYYRPYKKCVVVINNNERNNFVVCFDIPSIRLGEERSIEDIILSVCNCKCLLCSTKKEDRNRLIPEIFQLKNDSYRTECLCEKCLDKHKIRMLYGEKLLNKVLKILAKQSNDEQ